MWFPLPVCICSSSWCWVPSVTKKKYLSWSQLKPIALCKVVFVGSFFFYTLYWAKPHIHCPHARSGWLRMIILSTDYCREWHLHNQLTHSNDIAISLKHKPPRSPFLLSSTSFTTVLLSFMSTSPSSVLSEPSSTACVLWLVTLVYASPFSSVVLLFEHLVFCMVYSDSVFYYYACLSFSPEH